MDAEPSLSALIDGVVAGDLDSWRELVDRHAGLVAAVARSYHLSDSDVADVTQTVWLHLVEHLSRIRSPEALPAWLITTARHECLKVLRYRSRFAGTVDGQLDLLDDPDPAQRLVRDEQAGALREAFRQLSTKDRQLLRLLASDPPIPYQEISRRLHIPVGSIGPTRQRCIARVRSTPPVAALLSHSASGGPDGPG